MGTLRQNQVGRLTFLSEHAIKWIDRCIEKVLGAPFDWAHRDIFNDFDGRSFDATLDTFVQKRRVWLNGKIGEKKIFAEAVFLGAEDMDDPSAVILPDDMRGPLRMTLATIEVAIGEPDKSIKCFNFGYDWTDPIPGYDSPNIGKLVETQTA